MRNRIRLTGLAAGAAAVAMILTACGSDSGSGSGDGAVVRLATGVDPSYAAVYVAQDQGFFEDQGVEVEVSNLEGGPAMAQAIIAGQADMGTQSDATSVGQMGSDPNLTALLDFQHSGTYIKVIWGPDVTAATDIEKVATLPGLMTFATARYLESEGIDLDSVELVTATPPDVPIMLKNGDVDATVIYEPWATRSLDEAGGEVVGTIGDFDVSYAQWLITDAEWLADNEETAAKVAAAFDQANEFMRENPEETYKIVEDAIKLPAAEVEQIMNELVLETRDIDASMVESAKTVAQFFVDSGDLKEMPDLDNQIKVDWWSANKPS
jgi:NitT/TauT family transport system substrate-binding protein